MKKRSILGMALAAVMTVASVMPAFAAGWTFDGPENWQWRYENADGSRAVSTFQEIDGKYYKFDDNGYLDIGWRSIPDEYGFGNWKYFNKTDDLAMATSGVTDTGYINSYGNFRANVFNQPCGMCDDSDNAYWLGKIAEYGYGNTQPVMMTENGEEYLVYNFALPDDAYTNIPDGSKNLPDYIEVANAYINQTYGQTYGSWNSYWSYDGNVLSIHVSKTHSYGY